VADLFAELEQQQGTDLFAELDGKQEDWMREQAYEMGDLAKGDTSYLNMAHRFQQEFKAPPDRKTWQSLLDKPYAGMPVGRVLQDKISQYSKPELTSEHPAEAVVRRLPLAGAIFSGLDSHSVYRSAKRIESGDWSEADVRNVAGFVATQKDRADDGFGSKVLDILTHLPGFAAEFAATGGAFTAGRKVGEKVATGALGKAAGYAAGAAAQTVANPQRVYEATTERLVPQSIEPTADGGVKLPGKDEDFLSALPKGFLDTFIETGSERAGAAIAPAVGKLKSFFKAKWLGKVADRTPAAFQKALDKSGWNGVLGEMFEERVGDVARSATGLQSWEDAVPSGQQLLAEATAFMVPGAVGNVAGWVRDNPGAAAAMAAKPTTPSRREFQRAGLPPATSREERQAWVDSVRKALAAEPQGEQAATTEQAQPIPAVEAPSSPREPSPQVEAPGTPIEPAGLPEAPGEAISPVQVQEQPEPASSGSPVGLIPPGALPLDKIFSDIKKGTNRARAAAKRFLTSKGDLPEAVFAEKIAKEGRIGADMKRVEFSLNDYEAAAKKAYGGWGNISDTERAKLDAVLKGQASPSTIPAGMRGPVARMRREIDALSAEMIRTGAAQGSLGLTVAGNLGTYVTRAYRVFDDPGWASKVDPAVRNKAKALIQQEYPNWTDDQHERLINSLLYEDKAAESPIAVLSRSKLGSKDLSITKRRKDIAPEIRALWGEYDDPRVNYARSVTKMAHLIGNHKFLTNVRQQGLGQFFFEESDPNINPEAKAKIAADESNVMHPLNGLYTFPEVKKAFEREYNKEALPTWLKWWMRANGLAKYSKTVLSSVATARNFISNIPMVMSQGHWRAGKLGEAFKGTRPGVESVFGGTKDAWRDSHRRYATLGIIDESVHAGELQDVIKDAFDMTPDQFTDHTIHRAVGKVGKAAQDIYRAGDTFWKIYAFENERARYAKAKPGLSPDELDAKAAEIVRNTLPTYSMIPEGVRSLRRVPLVAPFVSFASERLRNSVKTIGLISREMKDPDLRGIAMERIAGQMLKYSLYAGAAAASHFLTGVGPDDEEDFREFVAPWNKNSTLVWTGQDSFIDLSYTDPDNILAKPFVAFMRGEDWLDSLKDAAAELAEPFVSEELVTERLLDIARNHTSSGRPVYSPQAPIEDKAAAIIAHIWEPIEPGVITSAKRINKGITGEVEKGGRSYDPKAESLAAITGFRPVKINVKQSLGFKVRAYQSSTQDANRLLTSEATSFGAVDPTKIGNAYKASDDARRKLFNELHKAVTAAIRLGMPEDEAVAMLDEGGLSKDSAEAVLAGVYEPYQPGQQTMDAIASRPGGKDRVNAIRKMMVSLSNDPAEAEQEMEAGDRKRLKSLRKTTQIKFSHKRQAGESIAEYQERRQRHLERRKSAAETLSRLSK
jgi:hypothetical protein